MQPFTYQTRLLIMKEDISILFYLSLQTCTSAYFGQCNLNPFFLQNLVVILQGESGTLAFVGKTTRVSRLWVVTESYAVLFIIRQHVLLKSSLVLLIVKIVYHIRWAMNKGQGKDCTISAPDTPAPMHFSQNRNARR